MKPYFNKMKIIFYFTKIFFVLENITLIKSTMANSCLSIYDKKEIKSDPLCFETKLLWNNKLLWSKSQIHSNDFFIHYGWDSKSESFSSDISSNGNVLSDKRYIIATSRMIYGLAHSSNINPKYLYYAKKQSDFLLNKMTKNDSFGLYFKESVDSLGKEIDSNDTLKVNYQAYGLNGLVALYQISKNQKLIGKIENIYKSFYKRFHDPIHLGFFDEFNVNSQTAVKTKSFNSTVYVATSFLLDLANLKTKNQIHYTKTIEELADKVVEFFPDDKTGWIIENFSFDWKPEWRNWQIQGSSTIGITGHNYQAPWFLMRASELNNISAEKKSQYLKIAKLILTKMLSSNSLDLINGGIFDAFKREDDVPMWNTNKAWWQQSEMILALTKAISLNLFFDDEILKNKATQARDSSFKFYFNHFIDYKVGGEFPVVQKNGVPILTENKGQAGTASYHQVELARFMKKYGK